MKTTRVEHKGKSASGGQGEPLGEKEAGLSGAPGASGDEILAGEPIRLGSLFGRVRETAASLPLELRKKIVYTVVSCLVLSGIILAALYAIDYLDFSKAESIIYKWHVTSSAQ